MKHNGVAMISCWLGSFVEALSSSVPTPYRKGAGGTC